MAGFISRRLGPAAAATALIWSLAACVPDNPEVSPGTDRPTTATGKPAPGTPGPGNSSPAQALPAATPTPTDGEPTADPEVAGMQAGGPAYEGTGGEPPLVARGKPAAERVQADRAAFGSDAAYADGVVISAADFSTGIVSGEGSGVVAGARYVLFTVTVRNGSTVELDLSAVVPTLQQGSVTSAPLYDEVDVADFAGTVAPGATASARYAFQLTGEGRDAALYLDLDALHAPAVFSGLLP